MEHDGRGETIEVRKKIPVAPLILLMAKRYEIARYFNR